MALPPLSLIKLQGLNPAYLIAGKDGKPNPNFIIQFNTLIQNLIDQINAIIIAFNMGEFAQVGSIAPLILPAAPDPIPQTAPPPVTRADFGDALPVPLMPLGKSVALPVPVTVGASPFTYQAPANGTVVIDGGVSNIDLTRDGVNFVAWPARAVPVFAGDQVRIVFPVTPLMTFVEG